jgi:hypothetical protein
MKSMFARRRGIDDEEDGWEERVFSDGALDEEGDLDEENEDEEPDDLLEEEDEEEDSDLDELDF